MVAIVRMRGIDAKLARAQVHVDTLKEEVLGYLGAEPQFLSGSVEMRGDGNVYPNFQMRDLGAHLGPICGDILHNVRSAYDHLIGQLVEVSGNKADDNTYFPMLRTSPAPDKQGRVKLPVHNLVRGDIHDVLLKIQPFTEMPEMPDDHFLAVLARLSNQDKHKELILVVHRADGTFAADVPTALPITFEVGDITVHQYGSAVAQLVPVGRANDYVDSTFTLTVSVCFVDGERGKPLLLPLAQDTVHDGREGIERLAKFL